MTELDAARRKTTLHTILLVLAIACVSTAAIAISGIVMVGRPLKKLVNKTRRMGDGDLTGPVRLNSSDELAELGHSLNAMCERLSESQRRADQEAAARLAAMEQLRHADRLKTVGRLASGIAHELGTPLNVVSGRASLIGSGKLNAEEVSASVEVIKGETDRMAALIQRLLDFSRRREAQRVTADVVPIVRQTIELLDSMAQNHKVQLNMTGEQPSPARADVSQLQQVFTNLIVNAIQAMPQGGTVHVSVAQTNADPPAQIDTDYERFVRISVRDEGAGIAAEDIEHIFEPFFTTKDVGEGTGLGLSIVHRIVDEHGGWIDVRSNPNEGSCFDVFLPSA